MVALTLDLEVQPVTPVADLPVLSESCGTETAAIGQLLLSLNVGGGEVLAARIARRLCDRYRFVFFCLDELGKLGAELRGEGFAVHVLGRRPGIDLRCLRQVARTVGLENIGVLHAHQYTPFFYASASRYFGSKCPVVFTEHGRFFPDMVSRKRRLANRLLLRRCDRVVGVGNAVRQALIENEGIGSERVQVIYNGIELERYECREQGTGNREQARAELGLSPTEFLIVHVARLDEIKDHVTAIRAFERVHKALPRARLAIIGEGPRQAAIEADARRRGLTEVVRLAGLRTDVPRWLAAADVAWLTSVSEGIPLTLIEALAAGVPVVATRVGGVPEVVEHEVSGLLAPAADDAAIAAAVLRLAGDAGLCRRLAAAGRARASECFSEDRMHEGYARLYQELLHA